MTSVQDLYCPALATCRRVVIDDGLASWGWADLAGPAQPSLRDQPPLPFAGPEPDPIPQVGEDVPAEVRQTAVVMSRILVEALRGSRPAHQLERWFDEADLTTIVDRARAERRLSPLTLASLRVQQPRPGAAEVTLRLVRAGRSIAAALRLEQRQKGWRVRGLVLGPCPSGSSVVAAAPGELPALLVTSALGAGTGPALPRRTTLLGGLLRFLGGLAHLGQGLLHLVGQGGRL